MIRFENNAHWYQCRDGKPRPQHDATLREARKEFLYPSVTTIDKDTFKNDFLDRWKMNELVGAAASNPKFINESDESYANRIYEESLTKSKRASSFGKELHKAIEEYPSYPDDPGLHPWLDRFGTWYNNSVGEVISRERILYDHDLGVAGRCDLIAQGGGAFSGHAIIPDWKSQDVKVDAKSGNKKPAFYDSWTRQLSVYAVSYAKEAGSFPDIPTCISVIIDSNEPCEPFVRVWKREEIMDAYADFCCGAYLWFSKRSYWPMRGGKFHP